MATPMGHSQSILAYAALSEPMKENFKVCSLHRIFKKNMKNKQKKDIIIQQVFY